MNTRRLVVIISVVLTINLSYSIYFDNSFRADVLPKFYVDDDYNSLTPGWQIDHFDVIQDAIDVSVAGDRIIVYEGTYNEQLEIDHKLDLFGEDKNLSIIDGGNNGNVITITSKYVNISHFTIRDCRNNIENATIKINAGNAIITDNIITSPSGFYGIFIDNCDSNIIYDNTIKNNNGNGIQINQSDLNQITYNRIKDNQNGIFLYNSSFNTIQNNFAIDDNSVNGIFLNETSNNNTISYNMILKNSKNGIFLNDHCDNNILFSNNIKNSIDSGIRLENSSSNSIDSNIISSNDNYGIMVVGANNIIEDCSVFSNGEHGIFLFADDNNNIFGNTISSNNKDGISMSNSSIDMVYNNEINNNLRYGINLDFFTFSNTIYNNYIHDNSQNGMDKSIGKNFWNISKTSGPNIVGGSFIKGNYWDSFDEQSEGITDSNDDGISESSYTIYGTNKDYGPILDIINPDIETPQVSPSTQIIGGYTYISVEITDNTEVKEVFLNVVDPNDQLINISITGNKTGNTWFCNEQFTPSGLFSFSIIARDPRNWETSISKTFYIHEGQPPSITDKSPSLGSPSTKFTFNATVVDDQDSGSDLLVKVEWRHGEKNGNNTMNNIFKDYFTTSVTLDKSTSQLVYKIYAVDKWGNSISTVEKKITITDTTPPEITINTFGPSSDNMPNKFVFGATITDNYMVNDVKIEYWHEGSDHITVEMDKSSSYYSKEILLNKSVDRVFCIIYASDPSGNKNNTKSPFADAGGPYSGLTAIEINFDGSDSFDLDGNITSYEWDFGDGTKGSGEKTSHIFTSQGDFVVKLTVTDDDGNKNTHKSYASINSLVKQTTSIVTLNKIEYKFDISLSKFFYGYDSTGDGNIDRFIDPNNVLVPVHTGKIDIDGNNIFLLSCDGNDNIPNFMWNSSTDEIMDINYIIGQLIDSNIDEINKIITSTVRAGKMENWIYLEISKPVIDEFGTIDSLIGVTKNSTNIDSDKIIEKDNKIYVLDDPVVEYVIKYNYKPPPLSLVDINPKDGIVNQNNPIITFTFNYPVVVTYADFYIQDLSVDFSIADDIKTKDYRTFSYTPPSDLKKGVYYLDLDVLGQDGKTLTINNYFFSFQPYKAEESEISIFSFLMLIGFIGIIGAILLLILRFKNINFESFIYVKNKKIIPFFKPVIVGPLRIDVDDENVKKAEFYVDGELKTTLSEGPFIWNWNEKSFLKKTIEAKVYDNDGKAVSSGEMTFLIFNSPRLFK